MKEGKTLQIQTLNPLIKKQLAWDEVKKHGLFLTETGEERFVDKYIDPIYKFDLLN